MKKVPRLQTHHVLIGTKILFWFSVGAVIGLIFFFSFAFIIFQRLYMGKIYPGVYVAGIDFSGQPQDGVRTYFAQKNAAIAKTTLTFTAPDHIATISAGKLGFGYDENLSAEQAYSVGRSSSMLSNLTLLLQAYINGIHLTPVYHYKDAQLQALLNPIIQSVHQDPVDALFQFDEKTKRVSAFQPSSNGQDVDMVKTKKLLVDKTPFILASTKPQIITIPLPIKIIHPKTTTDEVNKLGIRELIGTGTSLFAGSIESRIFNVNLAASRINGVIIAPGEVFSFDKALGDVSSFTGYKQAYVIQNGRTVLGDGGGVCQVSTTFFRAILNAGLPIVERHAHAYRVHYYEEDIGPGIDATIYVPSVDLKFKNDTGNSILVQTQVDLTNLALTFYLYGTKDGRTVTLTKPVITSQTPPPPPSYQDDPTLPKGQVKQVDFEAWGANVYFTRTVKKDGKVIISDRYDSNYRPWQAVFLRGTKEN